MPTTHFLPKGFVATKQELNFGRYCWVITFKGEEMERVSTLAEAEAWVIINS